MNMLRSGHCAVTILPLIVHGGKGKSAPLLSILRNNLVTLQHFLAIAIDDSPGGRPLPVLILLVVLEVVVT